MTYVTVTCLCRILSFTSLCIGYLEIDSLLTYDASYQTFGFLPITTSPKCIEGFKRVLSGGFLPAKKEQTSPIVLSPYYQQSTC